MIPNAMPTIGEEEIEAVADVLRSFWLTTGPRVESFEAAFSTMLDATRPPYCVAVSSATAGLHIALEAAGIRPGAKVLVPTWTFTATAHAVELAGATPVIIDVDPHTLQMDPEITGHQLRLHRADAILPVHLNGSSINMDALTDVLRPNTTIIEDCAHSLGGIYPITELAPAQQFIGDGSCSDAGVFSFYATKGITTGEGGMVVTRNRMIYDKLKALRFHGLDREVFDRHITGFQEYEVVTRGYKYNMADLNAALGLMQLRRLPIMVAQRIAIARAYQIAFKDLPIELPIMHPGHAWHLYQIRLSSSRQRPAADRRAEFLQCMKDAGIACGTHYRPLHRNKYWQQKYCLSPSSFPNAEAAADRVVSLPIFPAMTMHQVNHVIEAVHRFYSPGQPRPAEDLAATSTGAAT